MQSLPTEPGPPSHLRVALPQHQFNDLLTARAEGGVAVVFGPLAPNYASPAHIIDHVQDTLVTAERAQSFWRLLVVWPFLRPEYRHMVAAEVAILVCQRVNIDTGIHIDDSATRSGSD
jgi:hypothetical protein